MSFMSKYGVARHIYVPLIKVGVNNQAVGADWTPAAGDVKISKDGGAAANVTNLPTAIAMGNGAIWDFSLTAAEMQAAQVMVTVADSATKAVEDDGFIIESYGNASAQHAVDLADNVRAGLTALPNAAAAASGGLLISGSNAGTTTLGALTVTGSFTISDGLLIARSTSNASAITATGNGTGHGAVFTSGSGATGDGVQMTAASTNGNGLNATGAGTGHGMLSVGGLTGHGAAFAGGATSGNGINAAAATSGHGFNATGAGTTKHGIRAVGGATSSDGINAVGGGSGAGIRGTAGATGNGIRAEGGATSGTGFLGLGTAGNAVGIAGTGQGSAAGFQATGGATGPGAKLVGGATSGDGLLVTTTSGNGFNITPTAGHGFVSTGNGTDKHGMFITGGTAGTSDGLKAVAGTGGVDIRGNLTGNLTGTVDTVTGSVGSVVGNIGGNLLGTLAVAERNAIADALLDRADGIETGMTLRQAQRGQSAMLFGQVTGAQSGTEVFKNAAGDTTRITITDDSSGNRSGITLNL